MTSSPHHGFGRQQSQQAELRDAAKASVASGFSAANHTAAVWWCACGA